MPAHGSFNRRSLMASSVAALPAVAGCASATRSVSAEQAREQVRAAEQAFAATMARRDFMAFGSFIADDAVFINGGKPLRGRPAILEYWSRYFNGPRPPFAWEPVIVEVSAGASLGYTEGPVTSEGAVIARFYTTWQRQESGQWRVVFDNGYVECAR